MIQGWLWFVAALAVLLGLLLGNPLIMIPGMLLLVVSAAAWSWVNILPRHLHVQVNLSVRRARWGEQVAGTVELINDQPFPIPWVECSVEWPGELEASKGELAPYHLQPALLRNHLGLRWFEKVVRPFAVDCRLRGEYNFGPIELYTADPFGFFSGRKRQSDQKRLLVYPKTVPIRFYRVRHSSPFGGQSAASWIFDDPARFRGSREYRSTDPFSRIEWKATARTGQLHTRLSDASFAAEAAVVVNMNTMEQIWEGTEPEVLERTVLLAASLVRHLYVAGYRYAVYTNGFVHGGRGAAMLKMGTGERHWVGAMELLARVKPAPGRGLEQVLAAAGAGVSERSQILVVTARLTPALTREIARQRTRRRAAVLYTGDAQPPELDRIPLYTMIEKEPWHELTGITLV